MKDRREKIREVVQKLLSTPDKITDAKVKNTNAGEIFEFNINDKYKCSLIKRKDTLNGMKYILDYHVAINNSWHTVEIISTSDKDYRLKELYQFLEDDVFDLDNVLNDIINGG